MPSITERLRAIVAQLPTGAAVTLPADVVRAWLEDERSAAPSAPMLPAVPQGWRERLWTCPTDTRLGVRDLADALNRSADWVYRATNVKRAAEHGRSPLPCTRLDGVLVFTAAAVRHWLQASAVIVNAEPAAARLHVSRPTTSGATV